MEKEQFAVMATSDRLDMKFVVTIRSTGSCMNDTVSRTKNIVFDMLRKQSFDVDKIVFI